MAFITVNPNESIESALRRFKRKVMTEEIIKDLNNKQYNLTAGVYLAELSNLLKTRNV